MVKHICVIAEGYPTADDPKFTFVRQLVCSIADSGVKCSVIVPQSITNSLIRSNKKRPYHWIDTSSKKQKVDIYQPSFFSFSNIKLFGISVSHFFWRRAVINCYRKNKIRPDVLYGHFWHSGIVAAIIGKNKDIPVFVASGESKIRVRELYSERVLSKYLDKVNGVICVSSKNMEESNRLKLAEKEKMIVIPNAIENSQFYPENKKEARSKLGFSESDFIVSFTGAFIHRKGSLRLDEAIKKVGDVKSIFIGSGGQKPFGEHVLFCGKLPHDEIVHYLNASDVFVLPTLAEGCCNAIIEAMACGLPIISSDLSFNDDILDEKNSIRIDSNDINQIANAIKYLKDNPNIRKEMSKESLKIAKDLSLPERAKKILKFIGEKI